MKKHRQLLHTFSEFFKRFLYLLDNFLNSFPLHLLGVQLRHHWSKLLTWVFFTLVVAGQLTRDIGGPYLFLEPEYLEKSNFLAFFLLGITFAIFFIAYQLSLYIAELHRYAFLLFKSKPFLHFTLNNFIPPLVFILVYFFRYLNFHLTYGYLSVPEMLQNFGMFLLGFISITLLIAFYFSKTNQDILQTFGEKIVKELQDPRLLFSKARQIYKVRSKVTYYLDINFKIRKVNPLLQCDLKMILRVMRQNHGNALLIEGVIFLLFFLLGYFQDFPYAQIPAAGSFFLLTGFGLMFVSALSFWFQRIGVLSFFLFVIGFSFFNSSRTFLHKEPFFGMDYSHPRDYSLRSVNAQISAEKLLRSYKETENILNTKLQLIRRETGQEKPYVVFLNVSGGGSRAALWTFKNLQLLDSLSKGRFGKQTLLITGASGGMLGAAYYRELLLLQNEGKIQNIHTTEFSENISKDLLNSVIFSNVINLVYPFYHFELNGKTYKKDVGYTFEKRLKNILHVFDKKTIEDYKRPEQAGIVPMIFFTPTIVIDGRQLLISPQNTTYMLPPKVQTRAYSNEIPYVEFLSFFKEQHSRNTLYTSVLRASATFPGVLPLIFLPTKSDVQVADAGLYDNFGIYTSTRFLTVFEKWLKENTAGILLLQIRDTEQNMPIPKEEVSFVDKLLKIFSGTFSSITESRDFHNDFLPEYLKRIYGEKLKVVELEYYNSSGFDYASLSFHLSSWEKSDILGKVYSARNRKKIDYILRLLQNNE